MRVYRCQDTLEDIFTAIFYAYEDKCVPEETSLVLHDEPLLFAEDVWVKPDRSKVIKVMEALKKRFGEEDYLSLCLALASGDEDKAQAVYRTIARGVSQGCRPRRLFDGLADDYVLKAYGLARNAERELQHLKGFLRFQELENNILYARIGPVNNLVTFLMPHFADRLPLENFVIYDDRRNFFGIHPAGKQWYLISGEEIEEPKLKLSEEEIRYRELFRQFCSAITIQERRNPDLQKSMLPLRFQKYMVEFP
ncbi:MAG: TIGR03915 family putative DNA repair protein [Acetatifactor sp.]